MGKILLVNEERIYFYYYNSDVVWSGTKLLITKIFFIINFYNLITSIYLENPFIFHSSRSSAGFIFTLYLKRSFRIHIHYPHGKFPINKPLLIINLAFFIHVLCWGFRR